MPEEIDLDYSEQKTMYWFAEYKMVKNNPTDTTAGCFGFGWRVLKQNAEGEWEQIPTDHHLGNNALDWIRKQEQV